MAVQTQQKFALAAHGNLHSKKKSEKLYNFGKLYAKHLTYKDVYDYGK